MTFLEQDDWPFILVGMWKPGSGPPLMACLIGVKSVPLQAWSVPEGSTKLRFPDFMTTAQEGGKVVSHTHRPHLPAGNSPGTHFC